MVTESRFVNENPVFCDAAMTEVLKVLPAATSLSGHELQKLVLKSSRVAGALREVEVCLIEAMVPVVRRHVESGQIDLADGDDYLLISANLVQQLIERWLIVDLRSR